MSLKTESGPDIVVLNDKVHGMPPADYVTELESRLPDYDIRLGQSRNETLELVAEAPIVTGAFLDDALLEAADGMQLFAAWSAGVGHLPMETLEERGVAVTTASGIHGPNIAEQVIGYILLFTRRLHEGWRRKERREWNHYQADELQGSTVTILGLGSIGQAIAERLDAFGVETIGVRYTPEKGGPVDEVLGYDDDLDAAFARSDVLVCSCPLTEITEGIVDGGVLSALPTEAVLVNVARGGVVDTEALEAALRRNELRGAALDVTDPEPLPEDHPLWGLENCLITPHNAGHSPKYFARLADIVEENVDRIEESGTFSDLRNQA